MRNPPSEHRFKPGQSGNPSGRRKESPKAHKIRKMTQEQIEEVGDLILTRNKEALTEIIRDPSTPALKLWMAAVTVKGISNGDMHTLNALLDRLVGKIPVRIEQQDPLMIDMIEKLKQLKDLPKQELLRITEAKLIEAKQEIPMEAEIKE